MAIEKNNFKVSRFDSEFFPGSMSKESMFSDGDERSPVESDDDDEFDDADSGAGSDDFDLLELGGSGLEFCQVGDQTCSIPYELYDLFDLHEILSLDVWNECLTEEERFNLTQYLPDMDQETYMYTLKELFEGNNFHFGNPVTKLFEMLKGGLCEPRVALYRRGLNCFQRHQHYHVLWNYQNCMVSNLLQLREAWQNCNVYSVEDKLRVLNIVRSQKSLMGENLEYMQTDSSEEESIERLRLRRSKGRSFGQKAGHAPVHRMSPPLSFVSRGRSLAMEPSTYGKKNPGGVLKLVSSKVPAYKDIAANIHSRKQGHQGLKSASYGSASLTSHLPRLGKASGYDSKASALRIRDQMNFDGDIEEVAYGMDHQRDKNISHAIYNGRSGSSKQGKKRQLVRGDEYVGDSYMDVPASLSSGYDAYGVNLNVNQLSDIKILTAKPKNVRTSYEYDKKGKYLEPAYEDQMSLRVSSNGNHAEFLDGTEPYCSMKAKGEVNFPDSPLRYDEWDVRGRKLKLGRDMSDTKLKALRTSQQEIDGRLFHSLKRVKPLVENIREIPVQNGGPKIASFKANRTRSRGEETESDSSDQLAEEEDGNPMMMRKLGFPIRHQENSRSFYPKSGVSDKDKPVKKGRKESFQTVGELSTKSRAINNFDQHLQSLETGNYSSKGWQNAIIQQSDHLHSSTPQVLEDEYAYGLGKSNLERKKKASKKITKNGKMQAVVGGKSPLTSMKVSPYERRQKEASDKDFTSGQSKFLQDYFAEDDGDLFEDGQFGDSGQTAELKAKDHDTTIIQCSSAGKKRKKKARSTYVDDEENSDYKESPLQHQLPEYTSLKKRMKRKVEADSCSLDLEMPPPVTETTVKKPQKTFTLITPTVHTDFSFSIVHLLSSVRMSMITPNPKDSLEVGKDVEKTDGTLKLVEDQNGAHQILNSSQDDFDMNKVGLSEQMNTHSLTFQEIIDVVRSNPGDVCILETQEPLQDLIRGVLKILSSRTAPLGAKGWKPLVCYEKTRKCWSWIGPVSQNSSDPETPLPITSPESWGIPHKMLVKLVDSFANWLKSSQETLQQIGRLPAPPVELMQNNQDEKQRFRDLRAQKSLTTINPSSEEVRAYFRKEEQLRYSVPDRAFSYTAADGKKSIVAPLRRCGGKPTSKARDHFMLKRDRPPHVTILCLVRDAAARLPGSIGTRADVCTLIRDSQYIVEDVTDAQINQVVSGALDRLHYERDPCVQYDGERKLWVYLHREKEEEDFEDDGTSSTKKWKRQKKDATEQCDQVTVAYPGSGDQPGFDLSSDLNAEPSCTENDKTVDLMYDDTRQTSTDNVEGIQVQGSQPIMWETLNSDPMQDNELQSQENSTNEDFDDDTIAE